jgi:dihydroorotase
MSEIITLPGLVDPHVHFREPGTNTAETIYSGTMAALIGGYAVVADMPNNPGCQTWSTERVHEKRDISEKEANIVMAINAGSQPEHDNTGELQAMLKTAILTKLYGGKTTGIDRVEDYEGPEFDPIVAELARVAPDKAIMFHPGKDNIPYMIDLVARKHGLRFHIAHVNDPEQVKLVGEARREGLLVTCGVCPHHILKTSHDRQTEGKFAEMQPPLAHQTDVEQLMSQLASGEIQTIETDHAPHSKEAKIHAERVGGDCFGVPGIEFAVQLMMYQVKQGNLSMERLVDAMSTQPAALLDIKIGSGTFTQWSMVEDRIEHESNIQSQAGWTPYLGMNTLGKLVESRISGKLVYQYGKPKMQQFNVVSGEGITV